MQAEPFPSEDDADDESSEVTDNLPMFSKPARIRRADRKAKAASSYDTYVQGDLVRGQSRRAAKQSFTPKWLRIIAGDLRGQRVQYSGDPSIRPMKDRTRESVFNLLGGDLSGMLALDLFAGTGALGLEAISRGATKAIMLELQRPASVTIQENAQRLKVADRCEIHNVDAFRWLRYVHVSAAQWPKQPWAVFCCPPYALWHSDLDRLVAALTELRDLAPAGSLFAVEAELPFDIAASLPGFEWDVRIYKPAVVGIAEVKAVAS